MQLGISLVRCLENVKVDSVLAGIFGLIGSLIGGAASLLGVFVNQSMTRKEQHNQWLKEQKQKECRDLLSALSGAYVEVQKLNRTPSSLEDKDKYQIEEAKEWAVRLLR